LSTSQEALVILHNMYCLMQIMLQVKGWMDCCVYMLRGLGYPASRTKRQVARCMDVRQRLVNECFQVDVRSITQWLPKTIDHCRLPNHLLTALSCRTKGMGRTSRQIIHLPEHAVTLAYTEQTKICCCKSNHVRLESSRMPVMIWLCSYSTADGS
jgi:hypothetical protein